MERSSSSSRRGTPDASASASAARESHSSIGGDCTGVLLVGGASSRFGSPKALARFDGETLAARAWAKLAWCAERIAVGKNADALPLPFPVLDDGVQTRAPIYGLIAALDAAAHEVAVVVPVDCPLITEASLRALASEVAVPQTGPLPGAYTKSMLRELRGRAASGNLSLRGINATVVKLDPQELVNVNRPEELAELSVTDVA